MRALIFLACLLLPALAEAQKTGVYGGVGAGYGIVQANKVGQDGFDTSSAPVAVAFLGLRLDQDLAVDISLVQTRQAIPGDGSRQCRRRISMVDLGVLLHSTTRFPGVFARPALGVMMIDGVRDRDSLQPHKKSSSAMLSFGLGYAHPLSGHVTMRVLHTTHLAWRGDRVNSARLDIQFTF